MNEAREGIPVDARAEIERLDRFLAIADVTGRRFEVCHSVIVDAVVVPRCAMIAYWDENYSGEDFGRCMRRFPDYCVVVSLYVANDNNGGDPAAVRAELHRFYPFLCELPARASIGQPAVSQETPTRG